MDLLVAWRVKAALELAVGPGTAGTLFAAVVLVLGFPGLLHALIDGVLGDARKRRRPSVRTERRVARLTGALAAGLLALTAANSAVPGSARVRGCRERRRARASRPRCVFRNADDSRGAAVSAVDLVEAAGWDEREARDLHGLRFATHEPHRALVADRDDGWMTPVTGATAWTSSPRPGTPTCCWSPAR